MNRIINLTKTSFAISFVLFHFSVAAESISLKSLPEDGNIVIKLVHLDDNKYLSFINGLERMYRFNIVKKEKRQHGQFSFKPFGHNRISIYKTRGTTLSDGSLREIFQLFVYGKKDPYRLIAQSGSGKEGKDVLLEDFRKYEFSEKTLVNSKEAFLENCGHKPNLKLTEQSDARNYLLGIAKVCEYDELYKDAIKSVKEIRIELEKEMLPSFSIKGDVLIISSSKELFNSANIIYKWLKDNL